MTMGIRQTKKTKVDQIVLHELIYACNPKLLVDSKTAKSLDLSLPWNDWLHIEAPQMLPFLYNVILSDWFFLEVGM